MTKKTHALIWISLATLVSAAQADDKKPAAGAPAMPAVKPAEPAKPPEAPKPAQEMADALKAMAGTWKCTGTADMGGTSMDIKSTITHKTDLNGFWIQSSFVGTAGKLPPYKFTVMTTYDAAAKKWWRTSVNGRGGHRTETGTQAGTKITWEGDSRMMGNDSKVRDTEEMVGPKEWHVSGESSKDGGKTWSKDHEATCKK
ncbi:hypothetical protein BH11MYX3_BH11MYX3_42280 [soil metagenome]